MNVFAELKGLIAAAAVLTAMPVLLANALCLPERLAAADLGAVVQYVSSVSL